jgi:hypothetical protein
MGTSPKMQPSTLRHLLVARLRLKFLSMHSQKRQTPELPHIALSSDVVSKLHDLESIIVAPAPNLVAQLGFVGINDVPESVIGGYNLRVELLVFAEVCRCC